MYVTDRFLPDNFDTMVHSDAIWNAIL